MTTTKTWHPVHPSAKARRGPSFLVGAWQRRPGVAWAKRKARSRGLNRWIPEALEVSGLTHPSA